MKSEKGITLISLTIYLIVLTIVLAIMTVLSSYFFKNINKATNISPLAEFLNFNSFFTEQINHKNIKVLQCKTEGKNSYIIFDDGVQYSFIAQNKGIYIGKVKICRNVDECMFTLDESNKKTKVNVKYKSGKLYKNITYKLK